MLPLGFRPYHGLLGGVRSLSVVQKSVSRKGGWPIEQSIHAAGHFYRWRALRMWRAAKPRFPPGSWPSTGLEPSTGSCNPRGRLWDVVTLVAPCLVRAVIFVFWRARVLHLGFSAASRSPSESRSRSLRAAWVARWRSWAIRFWSTAPGAAHSAPHRCAASARRRAGGRSGRGS